jgi:hypothetical protein
MIAFILTFLYLTRSSNLHQKELYLIPSDYRGKVVVVYGKSFGEPPKIDDSTIVYLIPKDGILISQSVTHYDFDLRQSEFYLLDQSGSRSKLEILEKDSIFNSKDSASYRTKIGILPFGTIGSCNFKDTTIFCYSDFYIGNFSEMAKFYTPEMAEDFQQRLLAKAKWLQK